MIVSETSFLFLLLPLLLVAGGNSLPATIGVTYNPSNIDISPERVVEALKSIQIPAVRLIKPSPYAIRAFTYSSISLLLCVPNDLVHSFAANRTAAQDWIYSHVVPFYPQAKISAISVGMDVFYADLSDDIMPAIQNVYRSLTDIGIRHIAVSTTLSFVNTISSPFPPSTSDFQEPIARIIIRPLLEFLRNTNSSFMINLYPYTVCRLNGDLPIGYAVFQEARFNFHDDAFTGVRYHNLFDSMVDSVIAAMTQNGFEGIPLTVTETGWPSYSPGASLVQDATLAYAQKYISGLIEHLNSGQGTPLRKEGVAETYIFELFDEDNVKQGSGIQGEKWGILYANLTKKFHFDMSSSADWTSWVATLFLVAATAALFIMLYKVLSTN